MGYDAAMSAGKSDFGTWLKNRARERSSPLVTASGRGKGGLTIDGIAAGVALAFAAIALLGILFFDRYTFGRDALQVGGGGAAFLFGFIGGVLMIFAAVHGTLGRWKLTLPLLVCAMLTGMSAAYAEFHQKEEDKAAMMRGETVPAWEKAHGR